MLETALPLLVRNLPRLQPHFPKPKRLESFQSITATALLVPSCRTFARKMVTTATSTNSKDPLVWIDCEMTGLDPETDSIIEIYCLITNGQLDLLDKEGWGTVVHQPKQRMDAMDEWCTRVHGDSGLTAAVINSTVTPEQAAEKLLAYIKKYVPDSRVALLAGNSVHADQAFLRKDPYKKVLDHLHYRILDVSSIKEAARRWCPELAAAAPKKIGLHKAKDDILESIEEAKYYQAAIFQPRKDH